MTKSVSTPWGKAELAAEATVAQRAGERRFTTHVQLLDGGGEQLVRFAYATGGTARRGPVTLRARDVARLLDAIDRCPDLARILGRA